MQINLAHIREHSTSGGWIDFAVFDARSQSGSDSDNNKLLIQLTSKAEMSGLKIDQSALAYNHNGKIMFFGSKNLVDYLSHNGLPIWTHTIDA
ncbi:MAG: hypothetical protein Q8Q54_01515 [Methylococcales bacterium]|nr:hypothetical protein [Methylococcales bacterium]MDP3331584.1 hypothetical protein [Methylococcaceae bacterium]MDP3837578.1 hypothetical protein [Methylococcales bacterium]